MKIRSKLILYFGILLVLCFSIAGILTAVFLQTASNRLLYANVSVMNENIASSYSSDTTAEIVAEMLDIKSATGVETILFLDGIQVGSTFAGEEPDLTRALVASERYAVWQLRAESMYYYYTISELATDGYSVYVFRSEELADIDRASLFYAGFVGILFLVISVSVVSVFASRVFALPIRELAGYANRIDPQGKPEKRPIFDIEEFNELGRALEKAAGRLKEYRDSEREFLHNFSHEMKTPLTNIYGYAEGIFCGVLSQEESQNACKVIMNESEKLKDNINQILFLGRLDAVENTYKMQKVNLADVLADAMTSVQIVAKDANIELVFVPAEAECYLTGDAEKLEAAFVNILTNDIRYARSTVRIETAVTYDRYFVTIDDDGPGIPEADRERVFERYFIGFKGHTGLGLTITKSIIEAHGAQISASVSPAGGARFTMAFPKR
ncbi:MAG: HAMP domain-containing sensor histidine kinase [bacterium]